MSDAMELVQNEDGTFSAYDDTYDIVIHCDTEEEQKKVIEQLSTDWIPVSERLPESTLPVLCRVKSTTISCTETYIIGSCCNGCWFFQNDTVGTHSFPLSEYKVLAWRPLPEPYKED